MTDTFNLVQNISFLEAMEVSYYTMFRMKLIKRMLIGFSIVGFIGAFLNPNYKWYSILLQTLFLPLFLLTFFSVCFIVFYGLFMIIKPNYFKNIKIKFTHWGMEKSFNGKEFLNPWSKFIKYKENKKYIFLFYTKEVADAIPKKLFNSENELADFKNLLSEKVKQG